MKKYILLILLSSFIVSCSTTSIRSVVKNAYRENVALNQKKVFVYYTKNNQALSLDEEDYLRMLKIALNRQGMTVVDDSSNAEVIVAFCLTITDPLFYTSQEPVYNLTGGTGFYYGSVNSGYNRATYSGIYTEPYSQQYAGSRAVTNVVYGRYLNIFAFDKDIYFGESSRAKKLGEIPRIWECTVSSAGHGGSLPQVAPYLIWSMEKCFGREVQGEVIEKNFSSSFRNLQYPKSLNNKDVLDGVVKKYYPNGKLQSEVTYRNNVLDGITKVYDKNGKLMTESNFKDGKLDGITKLYYENGNLMTESNYKNYKDGNWEAISKLYSENGKLKSEINLKNDKLEGITKDYDENGKLKEEWNYKEGKLEGITKRYFENGEIKQEVNYKDGKPDGITRDCYENGLKGVWTYVDKDGHTTTCTCYDGQGSKIQCPKQ